MTGINVPVRIGGVTVMPGDLVVGDREGVYFIPPQFVEAVLDHADETHIHDEWANKFDEGKCKSSEIYGSPKDLGCRRAISGSIRKLLSEIHKQQSS
jgi:regulator of RNase E activity RraA